MDSTLPLYRQLSSRFFLLIISFFLLCLVALTLYFQAQQALTVVKYQQMPAIAAYQQRQHLLSKNDRLLSEIINSRFAEQFDNYYQSLQENLATLGSLSQNNRRLLERLTQQLQVQAENVARLSESSRRNIQLKDNVIIQLTLVADSLSTLITKQVAQQNDLYRQITQGKLADRTRAERAKALSDLINRLTDNRQFNQALMVTLVLFSQLDLQFDAVEFDYIQQQMQQEISHWLASASNGVDKNDSTRALFEQTRVLNALLFSEQKTFAKWRDQLHRANDFQAELSRQKAELMPLLDKALVMQPLKSSTIEQQLINVLAKVNIKLQPSHTIWLVIGLFLVLSIIFTTVLFSIRRKIQDFGIQSLKVVDELVLKGSVFTAIPGVEISAIIKSINKLSRPEHSEADFKQQQQQQQKQVEVMSRHSGHVFWRLPVRSKQKQQKLYSLLGVKFNHQHWRQCFSRSDVRAILSLARHAKKHQSIEKITLISNQEKAIFLTIEYIDGAWYGSLANAEEYRTLQDKNNQLQQQLKQQNQADKLAIIASSKEATTLASSAMLQRQIYSLGKGNEQLAYQQLRKILRWSEQQKICALLRRDDFILTLSTVKFANEMHTALVNESCHQAHNNNVIYLNMAPNLASFVTLESELFQAMITTICQKILTGQRGVELAVDAQVIGVNSAQQIVKMSFQLNKSSNLQSLSQVLDELASDADNATEFANSGDNYLHDLQLVFNVSNKVSQQLVSVGKFSFNLPLAVAQALNNTKNSQPGKLAKRTLLVIATEKSSRQRICHHLASSKAVVETMQDLTLFNRQISIKYLTDNRVDVIIISPEVYCSDYDLITQHLASLPVNLQPKILVIQPFYGAALQRTGLFSTSNLPWFSDELITSIDLLLTSDDKMNLLVEPEIFSPHQFAVTQVEVLLCVAEPSKNQVLLRILQWLGLQVSVVSQQESLDRHWQSGRYLVVISEFLPLKLELTASLASVRGVFALTGNEPHQQDPFNKIILPTSWRSGYLVPVLDIQKLTEQLSPWLKPARSASQSYRDSISQQPTIKVQDNDESAEYDLGDISEIEQALDVNLSAEQHHQVPEQAFDLAKFAGNQGSAELAAVMLDEYLADIEVNVLALEHSVQQQEYRRALTVLKSLIVLIKVISAVPLLNQCWQLSALLEQQSGSKEISQRQKEQLQQQLNHLKLCHKQLTEFAELI